MSKSTWIVLIVVIIVLVTIALLAMIIFLPNVESEIGATTYEGIDESSYTYQATKKYTSRQQEYQVTSNDIVLGRNKSIYIPGNSNPFTISEDLDIYGNPKASGTDSTTPGSTGSRNLIR